MGDRFGSTTVTHPGSQSQMKVYSLYISLQRDSLLTREVSRSIPGGDWDGRWEIRVIHIEMDFFFKLSENC